MKSIYNQLISLIEWSISVSGLTWEGKEKVENETENRTEIPKSEIIFYVQQVSVMWP